MSQKCMKSTTVIGCRVRIYFYGRIRSEGVLSDVERDLLAIAKFLVTVITA